MGFILLASLLYLGRFDGGLSTWLWFGGLAFGIGAFGTALVAQIFPLVQPCGYSLLVLVTIDDRR